MPLFACSKCNAVENTATGAFWYERAKGEPVLCSECATGTWHGLFAKEPAGEWWAPEKPGSPFISRIDDKSAIRNLRGEHDGEVG